MQRSTRRDSAVAYAHTVAARPESDWELLADHLGAVAEAAAAAASRFGPQGGACEASAAWAALCGNLHDFGKHNPAFQDYLRRSHAGEGVVGPLHAAAGARLLWNRRCGEAAAAVAGHHAGLADPTDHADAPGDAPKALRQAMDDAAALLADSVRGAGGTPSFEVPLQPAWLVGRGVRSREFFARMLFSALVDADRTCTARFLAAAEGRESPDRLRERYDDVPTLRDRLDAHVDALAAGKTGHVAERRAEVLAACRAAATLPPGLFSLTVPTGGGKTLSAMSFALRHAAAHGLRRVVVAIPYTSIIEQNARVYRDALGDDNVLEHHANLDVEALHERDAERETRRRLAAENWAAPVVVTTTVQLFESLFTNRPGKARKLHNLARSVIVLDEVQTLPPRLIEATVDALRELADCYGCTIVLSTATPPALRRAADRPWGLDGVREIVPEPASLAASLRRVGVTWRTEHPTTNADLAGELAGRDRVLAIVHRRGDAREIAEAMVTAGVAGVFHLSALMCPRHRMERLAEVRRALDSDGPVRLVATQLVEAGVDLDFPTVYRSAAGGLDAYAQAAGRCDREGKLTARLGRPGGELVVFRPDADARGTIKLAWQAAEATRDARPDLDLFDPAIAEAYFDELYRFHSDTDERDVQHHRGKLRFATVASLYTMIDDFAESVIVPYGDDGLARIERHAADPSLAHRRALQPLTVAVPPWVASAMRGAGMFDDRHAPLNVLDATRHAKAYDETFGLMPDRDVADVESLLV